MRNANARRRWIVRDGAEDVIIDLEPTWSPSGPIGDVARGRWDLQCLLWKGLRSGDLHLHRVLLDVYEELTGPCLGLWTPEEKLESVTRTLMRAAGSGRMVVRREPVHMPSFSRRANDFTEKTEGVGSTKEAPVSPKSWLGITLVDENGNRVPGRAYRVVGPGGVIIEGQLDSHGAAMIKDLDAGSCKISCPYVEPHAELKEQDLFIFDAPATPAKPPGNGTIPESDYLWSQVPSAAYLSGLGWLAE